MASSMWTMRDFCQSLPEFSKMQFSAQCSQCTLRPVQAIGYEHTGVLDRVLNNETSQ